MIEDASESIGRLMSPSGEMRAAVLDPERLVERQARADRLLEADGAGHLVHDLPVRGDGRAASIESRPWRIDPIPIVLEESTFRWLAAAVVERMEALEAVLSDLYGPQNLIRQRVVPAEVLAATDRYRINAGGAPPHRWLTTYAADVTLGADGAWYLVQDLTDAPPGLGYALLNRSVMARVMPDVISSHEIAPIASFTGSIRSGLASVSRVDSPRIVLFSGGLDHPSYVDHSYLAVQLGVHLVEGADLVVRQRKVWLRTLDGLEPVDVLYRRMEDATIDPLEVGAHGSVGVPGLLQAVRSGGVALSNAHGSGVVEAEEVVAFIDAAIDTVHPLRQLLSRLPHADPPLAHVPVPPGLGGHALGGAPVVVRLFAVHDGISATVMPGGIGRVLAPGDDPTIPTACAAKDVWVLGRSVAPAVGPHLPQVDFGRSLPTRAADALYWTNRAAERAEAMARTARVVSARLQQDPGLVSMHGGAWTSRMIRITHAVRHDAWTELASTVSLDGLQRELGALSNAVALEIGSLLTEATTVREYLSVTTGRVLAHLAQLRTGLQRGDAGVDDLDAVLADFAAFAGMWHESTVRGPAWRIGDTGRRLERCLVVLDLVDAAVGQSENDSPEVEAGAIEVLLAANESLVAYRRRHRSDVEMSAAIALLIHDETNPRSLKASIEQLTRHVHEGGWDVGLELAAAAREALALPLAELLPVMRGVVLDAGAKVVERWFSSPVAPIMLRPMGAAT